MTAPMRELDHRAVQAAKQIALALVWLGVMWVLASALAPDPTSEGEGARALLTMPFVAACVAVVALFAVNALAFDRSQLMTLGAASFAAGVAAGSVWFVLGMLTSDGLEVATVLHLWFAALLVTALVTAIGSLGQLLVRIATQARS